MKTQSDINFKRITEAIAYFQSHYGLRPDCAEIARKVQLSPTQFETLFIEWAGISTSKFMEVIGAENAKKILSRDFTSGRRVAEQLSFPTVEIKHDLFVKIVEMTPSEYKNDGKNLKINYDFYDSPFGVLLIASSEKGICHMAFDSDIKNLNSKFPSAEMSNKSENLHLKALQFLTNKSDNQEDIPLHLKGTDFQIKVWKCLLKIPFGHLTTYGQIAKEIGNPNASRAVGTAIGKNPIAYLIPCHRVIQSSGIYGGYMWGKNRKTAIIGWEIANSEFIQ